MSIEVTAPTPLPEIEHISNQIETLKHQLEQNAPGYESLLHTIHVALVKDESLSHLLKEEQIGIIVAGLSKKKNIIIAEATKTSTRAKTASGKSLKDAKIGVDL